MRDECSLGRRESKGSSHKEKKEKEKQIRCFEVDSVSEQMNNGCSILGLVHE